MTHIKFSNGEIHDMTIDCFLHKWNILCGIFVYVKNLYENRMCNQLDNWRTYGPEVLL